MTLEELIKELSKHKMAMKKPVRLSSDSEGNSFGNIAIDSFEETMGFFYIFPNREHLDEEA